MSSEIGLWTASWADANVPWLAPPSAQNVPHSSYLSSAHGPRLDVDPYLGRLCRTYDTDHSSWKGFHPGLSQDQVIDFARATHNEVAVVPFLFSTHPRYVLYRLFVLVNQQGYLWEEVLQSIVEGGVLRDVLRITKSKKRKGTFTQATALLSVSATALDADYAEVETRFSRMFGIMRRSYKARQGQLVIEPSSGIRRLSAAESASEHFAPRIATYLGRLHREQGFHTIQGRFQEDLVYYRQARERMIMSSLYSDAFTEITRQLASRASVRLESAIRVLLETESRCLPTVYNFYGERSDEAGTILVDDGGNIVQLNADSMSARCQEAHDNVATLARWTHMTHILSSERDDRAAEDRITRGTVIPYYRAFAHRLPTPAEIRRFWTFSELEYLEYWFYFLQVAHIEGLYEMTIALQHLGRIISRLPVEALPRDVPRFLPTMDYESFWIRVLDPVGPVSPMSMN